MEQTAPDVSRERPAPKPRRMHFPFDERIPRYWIADNAVATHITNALHLIFPAGERFFVRSVKRYLDRIEDPDLRAQVRGFLGQEGRHAHEHERFFRILESQGYDLDRFLRMYHWLGFRVLERVMPPPLCLAVTAAAEHFTAIMAENAFTDEQLLSEAHPVMRDMLLWHAAEEIEHKSVAFDVLQTVHPSYALRVAGLAVASMSLAAFWFLGTRDLLRQDRLSRKEVRRELARLRREEPIEQRVFLRGIREYMRRGFHPWDNDNLDLATNVLERIEGNGYTERR